VIAPAARKTLKKCYATGARIVGRSLEIRAHLQLDED